MDGGGGLRPRVGGEERVGVGDLCGVIILCVSVSIYRQNFDHRPTVTMFS